MYGYPSIEAAEVALEVVREWLMKNEEEGRHGGKEGEGKGLERVVFCCFEAKDERAYTKLIPYDSPRSFVDDVALLTYGQAILPTDPRRPPF